MKEKIKLDHDTFERHLGEVEYFNDYFAIRENHRETGSPITVRMEIPGWLSVLMTKRIKDAVYEAEMNERRRLRGILGL